MLTTAVTLLAAASLFLLGIWLSAFFSGGETGFYRQSFVRLNIDAAAGDRVAQRLIWFAQNPSHFVATTLVGNNVANYLTTFAIGMAAVTLFPGKSGWLEIVCTILISPVVFIFGELMPKNLYFRAPMYLMRRDSRRFLIFYRLFYVISLPLVGITRLLERIGSAGTKPMALVLGRSRLVQVFSQGRRQGLLTDTQVRLVDGLLHTAGQPVMQSMTPSSRVLGLPDSASREEVLDFARQYGVARVAVGKGDASPRWYGYYRVVDVAINPRPLASMLRSMPPIPSSASKLEALRTLRSSGQVYGAVVEKDEILGIVTEHGLVEQLFRPPHMPTIR